MSSTIDRKDEYSRLSKSIKLKSIVSSFGKASFAVALVPLQPHASLPLQPFCSPEGTKRGKRMLPFETHTSFQACYRFLESNELSTQTFFFPFVVIFSLLPPFFMLHQRHKFATSVKWLSASGASGNLQSN